MGAKLLLIPFLVLTLSCSHRDPGVPLHSLVEAYQLMDRGENAKAILVLEKWIEREPNHPEARLLLASAYLGSAGVDVYRACNSFQSVLFDKPLAERWWDAVPAAPKEKEIEEKRQPLELLIDRLDQALEKFRQAMSFLSRFPDVAREKWPLLDKSLENLNAVAPTKDIALYRILLRIIYIKSYVAEEILKDPRFGSREWACGLDLGRFSEGLVWTGDQFIKASEDLNFVYPKHSSEILPFQTFISALVSELGAQGPTGAATSQVALQEELREALKCGRR